MLRRHRRWLVVAAATLLLAGLLPGSAAFADDTPGIITGHLLDGTTPVAGVGVDAIGTDGSFGGETTTDASGAFTITDVTAGSYVVAFELPGGQRQFAHGKTTFESADLVAVTAGGTSTVDESLLPHGSLTGHVTNSDASPAANAFVSAVNATGDVFLGANADPNGLYTMPFVPPGVYTLTFTDQATRLSQSAHQRINGQPGDPFTVTAGAATTVDEQFLATGAVTGHLTSNGAPVAFATVLVENDFSQVQARTGPDGSYRAAVYPGSYRIQYQLSSGLIQWAHQQTSRGAADSFSVTSGTDTVVDEQLLPTGTLTGRLLGPDGSPRIFTQVSIVGGSQNLSTSTDPNGNWQIQVFPGTYKVAFVTQFGFQWATGKHTLATADSFVVAAGQTVRADDTVAATGTLTVTARDTITGQPLASFCAFADSVVSGGGCTDNGSVVITALPGTYGLFLSVNDQGYVFDRIQATIDHSGQNVAVDVPAIPAASMTATVKDAKTGAPLRNICLQPVATTAPASLAEGFGFCSDTTGQVHIIGLSPGQYNVFAFANDGVHGHQWIGPHGGVGAMKKATVLTVAAGQTAAIGTVKMDKRGTLTGIIRDKASGAPLPGAIASFTTQPDGLGSSVGRAVADANGRYTFTDLGPYEWPILFQATGFASEWSGHTGNRLQANPITVKAGKTKEHDDRLSRGITLTGLMTTAAGVPLDEFVGRVNLVNADSRDETGSGDTAPGGHYTIQVMPKQNVVLRVDAFGADVSAEFFYANSPDFEHATVVRIPKKGTTTINITLPATN
jgi:hypothetical protein